MNELIAALLRASQHRFIGRLGVDPEIKFLDSGSCVANARMAVNKPGSKRDDGQEPDWFKLELWGDKAQDFTNQCRKGSLVDVTGRIKTDRWKDRNTGEERTQLVITVESWAALTTTNNQAPAPQPVSQAQTWQSSSNNSINDNEVPF